MTATTSKSCASKAARVGKCQYPCTYSSTHFSSLSKHQDECKYWTGHIDKGKGNRLRLKQVNRQRRNKLNMAKTASRTVTAPSSAALTGTSPPPTSALEPLHSEGDATVSEPIDFAMDIDLPEPQEPSEATEQLAPTAPLPRLRPRNRRPDPPNIPNTLPEPVPSLGPDPAQATLSDLDEGPQNRPLRVRLIVRDNLQTIATSLGLWRHYLHRPTFDPDAFVPPDDLAKSMDAADLTDLPDFEPTDNEILNNPTWRMLFGWQYNGVTTKSEGQVKELVEIFNHPDYNHDDARLYRSDRMAKEVHKEAETNPILAGFKEAAIPIELPSGSKDVPPRTFEIPGFYYRPLTSLIRSAFAHPLASKFHFSPYRLFHTSPQDQKTQRVHCELYDSDAFIQEHDKVQRAPNPSDDPNCKREKVVAALMFWSDATQLANFGTANLWPIYLFHGNLSKYVRALPNSGACQHVAYIPKIPDSLQDELARWHTQWGIRALRQNMRTHCKRELMQGVWNILLDKDFLHAYKYGMVIRCLDGVERRVYPRIFVYSADYPEKVLLATIRDQGLFPCPRCLVPKHKLDLMGRFNDLRNRVKKARQFLVDKVKDARDWIYNYGKSFKSDKVEDLLKQTSSVPTNNAFVEKLGVDFPLSRMLVPDFMHEFELGVWKDLFVHLIRILHAKDRNGGLLSELNLRFRMIRGFGTSTIRRFSNNVSEMKQLAARDFEDILQCAIPVFDGLLPEPDNKKVTKLLYRAAEFLSFAKLRMHTDDTIEHLEKVTREFGNIARQFRDDVCSQYATTELPREVDRRVRQSRSGSKAGAQSARSKTLNLNTPKFHSLGDYATFIRLFGGMDAISTQPGELCHRLVKRLYGLTSKRKVFKQIGDRVERMEFAKRARIKHAREARRIRLGQEEALHVVHRIGDDSDRDERYVMSHSINSPVHLTSFIKSNYGDPAFQNFRQKLLDHLLARRIGRQFDGDEHDDFTAADRNSVWIRGDKIYQVGRLQVNYTTYDNRRDYDTINPKTHPDIMVVSADQNDQHIFWYARVLGVYHTKVSTTHDRATSQAEETMDFLFVRWFGNEPSYTSGFRQARLPKVGFVQYEEEDNYSFGFLDPKQVVRGCLLVPDFKLGKTDTLLPFPSQIARQVDTSASEDWVNYFVIIFVDRDMIMRYFGGGVGHGSHIQQVEYGSDEELESSEDEDSAQEEVVAGRGDKEDHSDDDEVSDCSDFSEGSTIGDSEDEGSDEEEEDEIMEDDDGRYASD